MVAPAITGISWSVTSRARTTTMEVEIDHALHTVVVPATHAGRAAARAVLQAWMEMAAMDAWPMEDPGS